MIDDAYESGEIEFPIQARMMQEEVLSTSGYAPKNLRLLNLLINGIKENLGKSTQFQSFTSIIRCVNI